MTLAALSRSIADRLLSAGIAPDEARLDAELLIRSALGWDRARWFSELPSAAPTSLLQALNPRVARRAAREPMAYVLGRCEFWGREFEVGPGVLIPRPETELIVEHALRVARSEASAWTSRPHGSAPLVIDVGTGSGCLAVTLALELPTVRLSAVDPSAAALAYARRNATTHGVAGRIAFEHTTLLGNAGGNAATLVVSNPPYVPQRDRETLPPEVRSFEPAEALFAGDDGLDVIRELVEQAAFGLEPGGWLIFEFGFGQGDAVRALLTGSPTWTEITIVADLQSIPRIAVARRAHLCEIGSDPIR